MSNHRYLTYRGSIRAAVGVDDTVAFVTEHTEGLPTAVCRINAEKFTLTAEDLPCGAVDLVADGNTLYVAGTDGHLYRCAATGAKGPAVLGAALEGPAKKLAVLSKDRLAALVGPRLIILSSTTGQVLQQLDLPGEEEAQREGSAMAADASGHWLAVGSNSGLVAVYEAEEQEEFQPSEFGKLHNGAVTALLFEPEELRFYSAGADQKLLLTHARGKLEPEDRGRSFNHDDRLTTLILGPDQRFYSGGLDRTVKSWPRGSNAQPRNQKDDISKVVDLVILEVHQKPRLVVVCSDNTLRVFALKEGGRFGDPIVRIHDGYSWAENEFESPEPKRREAALKTLAEWNDSKSVDLLHKQVLRDSDYAVRKKAAELLAASDHDKVPKLLEGLLKRDESAIRKAALAGLRWRFGQEDLRPLDLALETRHADIGIECVQALQELSQRDDQALQRLVQALDHQALGVRQAALLSLESVYPEDSPEADLTGLNSSHADLRRLALVRLYQRKLLELPAVQGALRWRGEDRDSGVRQTAFLVSLHTRPALVTPLRARDEQLHRQVAELEAGSFNIGAEDLATSTDRERAEETQADQPQGKKPKKDALVVEQPKTIKIPPQPKAEALSLRPSDYDPLLQAMASRALDTCLLGAGCLATLEDPRAFGLLLQLSRESRPAARVQVCRALASLDDARSIKRLRTLLNDDAEEVRDAAYTALTSIYQNDPILGADTGLQSSHLDIRRRGLLTLTEHLRKTKPTSTDDPAVKLLARALDDGFETIRSEAFKATLNLKIGGGGPETLQFALTSSHADIRREVLTDLMANVKRPWAPPMLRALFNDPAAELRKEAFEFVHKQAKHNELDHLKDALASSHEDIRLEAVEHLRRRHSHAAQTILLQALNDRESQVRQAGLDALVNNDAVEQLRQALANPDQDVRVKAGHACARHGDKAALQPLIELATQEKPKKKEEVETWSSLVCKAVAALGELGDPEALPQLEPLLQSKQSSIRRAAAGALVWIARPETVEVLRKTLSSDDQAVKYQAALGLAFCQDRQASALLFTKDAAGALEDEERLIAAFVLGGSAEDALASFLDVKNRPLRGLALLLTMLLEWKAPGPTPDRCLAALSSRDAQARLTAAQALELFPDTQAMGTFLDDQFNEHQDREHWKIKPETIDAYAELVVYGPPHVRARLVPLLRCLEAEKQTAWNQGWGLLEKRFAAELKQVEAAAKKRKRPPSEATAEELRELAFGAYVGLVREQSSSGTTHSQLVRIRQTALRRVLQMAQAHEQFVIPARPVLVQAMGDPNKEVRMQAFESLQTLGVPSTELGAEALEAGHTDLGVLGLKELTDGASTEEGQEILRQVMLSRSDELALEAGKLLVEQIGPIPVASRGVEAKNDGVKRWALDLLAEDYKDNPDAQKHLRSALQSRFSQLRYQAALKLAYQKDSAAYESLVRLLNDPQQTDNLYSLTTALEQLGDPRTPEALLDRLERGLDERWHAQRMLSIVGQFRQPESMDHLLKLVDHPQYNHAASEAALMVTGYDRAAFDNRIDMSLPYDKRPNYNWDVDLPDDFWQRKEAHPHRDDLLARLLQKAIDSTAVNLLNSLLTPVRLCPGSEVDRPLSNLIGHPDDSLRHRIVEVISWRVRRRNMAAQPLLTCLESRDPGTKFRAAEGLALAGRNEGISVLLAAVDLMEDFSLRKRAVAALGVLADERALDMLLKLANDQEHALQEDAAEALGHLGQTDKAEQIFQLLSRLAKGMDSVADQAIRGLRWLNTRPAWNIIRQTAAQEESFSQDVAVELLRYNDDPATRELLLKLIAESPDRGDDAYQSARFLFGDESMEPDYALLRSEFLEAEDQLIDRMRKRGQADQILQALPRCNDQTRRTLSRALLNRTPPPVAEAVAVLEDLHPETVEVAAHLIGRSEADQKQSKPLTKALKTWLEKWNQRRDRQRRGLESDVIRSVSPYYHSSYYYNYYYTPQVEEETDALNRCVMTLIWACGRLGTAHKELVEIATAQTEDTQFQKIRLPALQALLGEKPKKDALEALEQAAAGDDAAARTLAVTALAEHAPKRAADLAERLLTDRTSLGRLAAAEGVKLQETLRQAAANTSHQGVVLPHLISEGDLDGLVAIMTKGDLPEAARLGAIEAIARLCREDAELQLVAFAKDEEDEDLRKAAWRGRRRSIRARQKLALGA